MKLNKYKKVVSLGAVFAVLSSCTCGVPLRVTPIQKSDKKLTCKDVILEINESEQYREQAANEKGIGLGEALAPICWINSYLDGRSAIKAANERIDYLGHIYDLMDCGGSDGEKSPPPPVAIQMQQAPAPLPAAPVVNYNITAPVVPPPPPPPPAHSPLEEDTEAGKSGMVEAGNSYYKLLSSDGKLILHEHLDKNGKKYVHSHPSGDKPHRHLEDERKQP
jgi:hypothetical protein